MNKKLLEFKHEEITLTEAANRYGDQVKGIWTFDTWAKGLEDEIKGITFYVYKDHIIIDYIDLNPEGSRVEGYVFEKGITVEGSIYNEADDFGIAFISLGDVYAKNIYLGGGDFYVDGNVEVEEIAGGRYDHSNMRVERSLKCKVLLIDDYNISIGGKFEGMYPIQQYGYLEVMGKEYPMDNLDLKDLLKEEVVIIEDGESVLLDHRVISLLEEGKSILKEK